MKKNTFWISSAPRNGSMWLFNVTREILKISGSDVLPKKIPQWDEEMLELYEKQAMYDQNELNKYVLKLHTILNPDLPRSKILSTIRDPRDICISFLEFMKTDFQTALKSTKSIIKYSNTYNEYDKDYLKIIKYENIENKSIETVLEIAKFINCEIDYNLAKQISEKFNKDNVKKIINKNNNNLKFKIENKEKISESEIVYFSKTNYRSYDINTGFQTGHVSERKSGDWKKKFSSEEIEIINSEFKQFLIENDYHYF